MPHIFSAKVHQILVFQARSYYETVRRQKSAPTLLLSVKAESKTVTSIDFGVDLPGNKVIPSKIASVRMNIRGGREPSVDLFWAALYPPVHSVLPANSVNSSNYLQNIPKSMIIHPQFLIIYIYLLFQKSSPFELDEVDVGATECFVCT